MIPAAIPVAPFLRVLLLGYVWTPQGPQVSAWQDETTGIRWVVDQQSGRVEPMDQPAAPGTLELAP